MLCGHVREKLMFVCELRISQTYYHENLLHSKKTLSTGLNPEKRLRGLRGRPLPPPATPPQKALQPLAEPPHGGVHVELNQVRDRIESVVYGYARRVSKRD